jgi:hypothetical protein
VTVTTIPLLDCPPAVTLRVKVPVLAPPPKVIGTVICVPVALTVAAPSVTLVLPG